MFVRVAVDYLFEFYCLLKIEHFKWAPSWKRLGTPALSKQHTASAQMHEHESLSAALPDSVYVHPSGRAGVSLTGVGIVAARSCMLIILSLK